MTAPRTISGSPAHRRSRLCLVAALGAHLVSCASTAPTSPPLPVAARVTPPPSPAARPLAGIALGQAHSCARTDDGRVRCWGRNHRGQLGDSLESVVGDEHIVSAALRAHDAPPPVDARYSGSPRWVLDLAEVTQLAAGANYTCALLRDHTVACWGSEQRGQLGVVPRVADRTWVRDPTLTDVAQIAAGARHTCALLRDGAVRCWGDNEAGQCGGRRSDAEPGAQPAGPEVEDLAEVVQVAAGATHTCAVFRDGTARCWGANDGGQLGAPPCPSSTRPVVVPALDRVVEVAAGYGHTCARLEDGTARCWGDNEFGALGDGTTQARFGPAAVAGLTDVVQLAASDGATCARRRNGSVWCWGRNDAGQLGDGTRSGRTTPAAVVGMTDAVDLAMGPEHTCVRRAGGALACWGESSWGRLGTGLATARREPSEVLGLAPVSDVSLGEGHSCARTRAGDAACWGWNFYGQVGTELPSTSHWTPRDSRDVFGTDLAGSTQRTPAVVPGLTDTAQVGAGGYHSCALLRDGTVRCWGINFGGELGVSSTERAVHHPAAVEGVEGAIALAVGVRNCVRRARGGVLQWPSGIDDQLEPVATGGAVAQIACGAHRCAVRPDGSVWCEGLSDVGRLGDGTRRTRVTFARVPGLPPVARVVVAGADTCALGRDGSVWCWGRNDRGQLGDGTTTARTRPTRVAGLTDATDLALGWQHACARSRDGSVWCWGRNDDGQLGDGTTVDRAVPTRVGQLDAAAGVAVSGGHSCAWTEQGAVFCWGRNEYSQLGEDPSADPTRPAAVRQ